MRKLMRIAGMLMVLTLVVVLMGFSRSRRSNARLRISEVQIMVNDNMGLAFLTRQQLGDFLLNKGLLLDSMPLNRVDYAAIERAVTSIESVRSCEVFADIDGNVRIETTLRRPLVRIIHRNGMSNYLDELGEYMPVSRNYTARVPVVTGEISESANRLGYRQIISDPEKREELLTDDIFNLALFIDSDEFLKAQIEQIVVDKNNEVILIPKVGEHKIVFGKVDDLEKKFRKLKIFYKEGLSHTDWSMFSEINLKFDNQIVCTKK